MGKKALSRDRRKATCSAINRSKRNIAKSSDKPSGKLVDKLSKEKIDIKVKDEVCSICLNQIKKPSFCSGCLHSFCFDCIQRWSSVSENKSKNSCPVCRKEYSRILKNLNQTVRTVKLDSQDDDRDSNLADEDPFFIFQVGQEHMIGLPFVDEKGFTNNIVQLSARSLNDIPEIDVINMTRSANNSLVITKHNYQLKSSEQDFLNRLISSAVNLSVEEHSETVKQLSSSLNSKKESEESSKKSDKAVTNLVEVYSFDRLTERPRNRARNHNLSNLQPRYDLRNTTLRQAI